MSRSRSYPAGLTTALDKLAPATDNLDHEFANGASLPYQFDGTNWEPLWSPSLAPEIQRSETGRTQPPARSGRFRSIMASDDSQPSQCSLIDISTDFDRVKRTHVFGPVIVNQSVVLPAATVTVVRISRDEVVVREGNMTTNVFRSINDGTLDATVLPGGLIRFTDKGAPRGSALQPHASRSMQSDGER